MFDFHLFNFFGFDYLALVFLIFGLLFGSFANVIIYRLPADQSIVSPRSRCPQCQSSIAWHDNIPVVSYLMLRGKCRRCSAVISWRYPLVELIMGVLFCALYSYLGLSYFLVEALVLTFGLVTVSFIDFDHMILPDVFTISGIILGLVGALLNPERDFVSSLAGVVIGGGFLWCISALYFFWRKQEGMGGGDIKLLAWIGAVLGWKSIPFVILSSSLIGTLVGVIVMIRYRGSMQTAIPFGPYLALGAIVYIFGGAEMADNYIRFFIPSLYSL